MCWETNLGILSVPRIAKKDIHVKKAFSIDDCNTLWSFFHGEFRWEFNRKYKGCLDKSRRYLLGNPFSKQKNHYVWRVNCGFHSAKDVEITRYQITKAQLLHIGTFCYKLYDEPDWKKCIIHDCIIPIGSKYYVNEYGEYVSDQLIVLPN